MYAIVDTKFRKEFEENYHMPYGYGDCEVYKDLDNAIDDFNDGYVYFSNNGESYNDYVIEMYDRGTVETVYTIDDFNGDLYTEEIEGR